MGSPKKNEESKGFFAAMSSGFSMFSNAMHRSVNGMLGYEGVEVINPEGGKDDAEEEAHKGRWRKEERDGYWKMMHKYIGSDVTSLVTLPVIIFEPMTMLQKMAELMEYSYLLDKADESEDPYMRLVYACELFPPVSHHPPMSAGHAENEHFTYDVTSKLKTKFLGNSVDVYPVGSLEEKQRAEKRTREAKGQNFTPRWFDLTEEVTATPWGDLEIYQFNGKYAEHRAAVDNSGSVDGDVKSIEFNPWQYGNLSTE
ncbi:unnamed protein product [Lupinus luteus]|uniref:Uncharacterized protein n=1 Tax=Lupinus luteus TaxID=3873 RepID=A0AAV1W586_LUPLU